MSLAVAATVFALIFATELPDKTFIASIFLGNRYRPLPVWLGVSAAFTIHAGLAVAAGGLLTLLPHRVVDGIVAVGFAAGAAWSLLGKEEEEEEKGEAAGKSARHGTAFATSFGIIFLAEWGDLTQLLTAELAARYHDPISVFVGSALGLSAVGGVGVTAGTVLEKRVPLALLRRIMGVVLAGLAIWSALAAAGI